MFYFSEKPIWTKSNIRGMYFFFRQRLGRQDGVTRKAWLPQKIIYFSKTALHLEKSLQWKACNIQNIKRSDALLPQRHERLIQSQGNPEGFTVCFVFKGGYAGSPTGIKGTSQTGIKMHSKRCRVESFCRANLFKSSLQSVLSTNCSFNKSWIYTQTFKKQINK